MPVEGLPSAVDVILNALLKENTLSSYKIDGKGDTTIVVLRLTGGPPPEKMSTYRRKPPSQILRDQTRAETRKQAKDSKENELFPSYNPLFIPTPPEKQINNDTITSRVDLQTDNTPCGIGRPPRETRTENNDPCITRANRQNNTESVTTQLTDDLHAIETDELDAESTDIDLEKTGYDLEQIKQYIGAVDRRLQRRLRDRQRNVQFKKIVLDTRFEKEMFVCESDDVVLLFDNRNEHVDHWFFKRLSGELNEEENQAISDLRRWAPINRVRYKEVCERAEMELKIIRAFLRHYMG